MSILHHGGKRAEYFRKVVFSFLTCYDGIVTIYYQTRRPYRDTITSARDRPCVVRCPSY